MIDFIALDLLFRNIETGKYHSCTLFISDKAILRVTVRLSRGKIPKKQQEYVVTSGKPNFREREWKKKNPTQVFYSMRIKK